VLTKILITLGVIIVVAMVFRTKRLPPGQAAAQTAAQDDTGIKPRTVAYALAGVAVLASIFFYYLKYTNDHQVMLIRVTSAANGQIVTYEAYRSDIKGKSFQTIDGRQVTIGDAERFEVLTR